MRHHTLDFYYRSRISRKEDAKSTDVHFVTTQFFSKLVEDGPDAVSSWTAKKNIDTFKKKFIFIPVNERLHWSLCIVVNAGKIENPIDYYDNKVMIIKKKEDTLHLIGIKKRYLCYSLTH